MFTSLTQKFASIFRDLAGYGKLTETNVSEALYAVRQALLEADVHFKVVKSFTQRVREKAMGIVVHPGLNPSQQFVKVVHEELVGILGGQAAGLAFTGSPPTIVMVVGLQGSGKTTTAGKLARLLAGEKHRPYLIAADTYRPAAIDQLETIGRQIGVEVYADRSGKGPVQIAVDGLATALGRDVDTVLVDTAGRLHIDEEMMREVEAIRAHLSPHEILLVVDAMTGQDAVRVATEFNTRLEISGVILTKLDGDARGGAALSVREVTGKPIKFVGVGEKLDALQPFHPERMAQRILGMGDVLSLIEKVEQSVDQDRMRDLQQRMFSDDFNLQDFLEQFRQVRRLGPLDEVMKMIPGFSALPEGVGLDLDERQIKRTEGIILSMTPAERAKPQVLDGSRRKRIARGSGTTVQDVNGLLKQFYQAKQMMKQMSALSKMGSKIRKNIKLPFLGGGR